LLFEHRQCAWHWRCLESFNEVRPGDVHGWPPQRCWAVWLVTPSRAPIKQEGSTLHIATLTRGLSVEEGGYHWSGELRLWDNEILMGWYAANDGSIRSKGTMYFVMHPHGLNMSGRWVGLGYDDQIMTGFASMAHSREISEETMTRLIHSGGEVSRATE